MSTTTPLLAPRRVIRGIRARTIGRMDRLHSSLPVSGAHALTRVGAEEDTSLPFEDVWNEVVQLYRTGLHPAIGLNVRHRGRVVLDRTIGHVEHNHGSDAGPVATPETPFNLFSASKILTAMIVHSLHEDGLLDIDGFAAEHMPEIANRGKERIRIRHLLAHTAGVPNMPAGVDVVSALRTGTIPWDAVANMPLLSEPGTKVAYHPVTSWTLLEEICNRVSGRTLRELATERLLGPTGIDGLNYGVPHDQVHRVAKHTSTGLVAPGLMARIFERTIGVDLDTAVQLSNEPDFLTSILPSANLIGTGRQVTKFLQLLLNRGELDGVRVLKAETVDRAVHDTTPTRLDGTFGFPMKYGLGLMRGGSTFSLFGLDTKQAFGHLGFTNVVVYADPSRDLAVSFLNTGKPMLAPGMVRWYQVLQKLATTVPRSTLQ